ncbi:hypothetical protein MPSEU_000593200 [Mayamaea pseudoterrestris]|nr:hypothetical protein MPSEU_000593200 [Mayamaea pseudoterrestris]
MIIKMIRLGALAVLLLTILPLARARPLIQVEDFFTPKDLVHKKKDKKADKKVASELQFFVTKGMPKMVGMAEANSVLDEWRNSWTDLSLSLSMSMKVPSISPRYPTIQVPTHYPGYPTVPQPTYTSPTAPAPTQTPKYPTALPPVVSPAYPPFTAPTYTPEYPSTRAYTTAFTCTDDGVGITETANATTIVDFRVGYLIESKNQPTDYLASVENLIVESAIIGALQCASGGLIFAPGVDASSVDVATIQTDQCTPTQSGAACTVWQTEFTITIAQEVDPSVASYLGYMFVQTEMEKDAFVNQVPSLDEIEYLSPSPLLPPITGLDGSPSSTTDENPASSKGDLSVNQWTLGAVLTMCIGGAIALAVWVRNRRTRNERHLQLMEDISIASPADHLVGHERSDEV